MGINGLVLAPQDSVQMVKPVEQVVAKGIPVVIIDSGLDKEALAKNPDLIVKYVATDNYHGGQLAAERLLKVLNEAGVKEQKIVLFRYQAGSESTEQREKGFHDAIDKAIAERKPDDPTITWLSDNQFAGATVSDAEKTAGPLLESHPRPGRRRHLRRQRVGRRRDAQQHEDPGPPQEVQVRRLRFVRPAARRRPRRRHRRADRSRSLQDGLSSRMDAGATAWRVTTCRKAA